MVALSDGQRQQIREIARQHGAEEVRLFGSFARSDGGTRASDIDLLVRLAAGRGLLDLVAIKQDVEAAVDRAVDVVTEQSLSPYLRDRVLREAELL